jgi:cation:H+ antiporter
VKKLNRWIFGFVIAAGIWLVYVGEDLARILNLGENFIGSLFPGFATTLPEITVSVVALSLGAKEMAVANMFGSNLFNITIIFINGVLYRKAPIIRTAYLHGYRGHLYDDNN